MDNTWDSVRADYKAGVLPVDEIARKHGVKVTEVMLRAVTDGWNLFTHEVKGSKADVLAANMLQASNEIVLRCISVMSGINDPLQSNWRLEKESVADVLVKLSRVLAVCRGGESDSFGNSA